MKGASHKGLRILPLGGLGEIGMNCMVLEWEDEIILIDCGILFSDLEHFGVEFVIPDFKYLLERKDKIRAIVVTHGHEDHIGAISFAYRAGIEVPIYCSPFTSLLVRDRLAEYGLEERAEVKVFNLGESFGFERFKVQTIPVNHSIVEAVALAIDTPVGKIIHTGDFKIDPEPYYGKPLSLEMFKKLGDEGVLLLMSDSTNVERCEHSMSERTIMKRFEQLFADAQGMVVVSMFSSNVARMGQVFDLAASLNKKIILAGRSMESNVSSALESGYLKNAPSLLVPLDEIERVPRRERIVLSTGSQGEYRSALMRVAFGEHRSISLEQGDLVVMSSKFIPGNEKAIGRMINQLFKQGAEVLYDAVEEVHVSGHATRPELKQMLEAVRPKFFLPVHGEYRHLVHHAKVAEETGVPNQNIQVATNGDLLELEQTRFEYMETLEENRVLIETDGGTDVTRLLLKDRRQMAEKGVVFALLVRNAESGKVIAGPEVLAKGLVSEDLEKQMLEEAKKNVLRIVRTHQKELKEGGYHDLPESIRIGLRRFFLEKIGRKPVVIPYVLDL